MKSLTSLGYGVYIPPPGMPGSPWKEPTVNTLTVDELRILVEQGTLSALFIDQMIPLYAQLLTRTQKGAGFITASKVIPDLTPQQRAVVANAGVRFVSMMENQYPLIQKQIPDMFNQLDQVADLLAKKSQFRVLFYGPVYYKDQGRTSILKAERVPSGEPKGTYDFLALKDLSQLDLINRIMLSFPKVVPILEKLNPQLEGQFDTLLAEIREARLQMREAEVGLGAVPVFAAAILLFVKKLLVILGAHMNLTVIAGLGLTGVIVGVFFLSGLGTVTHGVASVAKDLVPAFKAFLEAVVPPLLSGVQWIMIFVGLGLGIGLIFAGPTLINRLEGMFQGAVREAGTSRRIGRDVAAPKEGEVLKEAKGF